MSAAFDEPPVVEHKSLGGFIRNFGKDVSQFIEGIPAMIRVAWNSGAEIVKNREWIGELFKHPEYLTKELEETWTQVVKSFTDTYKDGLWEGFYKHPFTVLLDATTVADVAGVGVKAAGKVALKAGSQEAAMKIAKLGDDIQRLPGRIMKAPFTMAGNTALKVPMVRSIAENLALTPLGLTEKNALGSQLLQATGIGAGEAKGLIQKGLSKIEAKELWDVIDGEIPLDMAKSPKVKARAELWHKYIQDDERLFMELGAKNTDELADARLKPLANRMKADGRFDGELHRLNEKGELVYTREALDAAKKWASGENPYGRPTNPDYHPFFHQRTLDLSELLESLKSESQSLQYISRFEKKTGLGPGIIDDPDVVMARNRLQMAQFKGIVNYTMDAIGRLGVPLKGVQAPPGYKVFNPILLKYIEGGLINGYELLTKNALEYIAGAAPGKRGQAFLQAIGKTQDDLMKSNVWKEALAEADNPAAWNLAIPNEVAYLIESQLKGVSGPLRFYDNIMNTWRTTVLTLMPRYYVNNILGNAVLLMFGGVTPFSKSMAPHKGAMPGEAMSSASLAMEADRTNNLFANIPGMKKVFRAADTLGDITDTRPRQVLVTKNLAEGLRSDAAMGDAVAQAQLAGRTMTEAVQSALEARRELLSLGTEQAVTAKRYVASKQQGELLAGFDKQMVDIQKRIQQQKALSNASIPSADSTKIIDDLEQQLKALADRRQAQVGSFPFPAKAGDDIARLEEMRLRREALAPVSAKVERAVTEMERFLGNYGRLHPIEREWIRRVIPFWTFAKTMNQLLFQLPFVRPKTAFLWHHYSKLMLDAANDDRLPYRFRNMIPIGGTEDGHMIFMRIGGFNPFEAVGTFEMAGQTLPKMADPAQNPFVKVFLETRGGYDTFLERPFTEPTDFVSLNGTVWRYDPTGKVLEPVIPQKPLIESLYNQIPHVKLVMEALDAFSTTRDLAGNTRRDPEGNYIYDRQWWYAASRAMGFPVSVQDPQRVAQQHHMLVQGMVKRYRSAARRVDPETRAQLEHILNDLANGGWEIQE